VDRRERAGADRAAPIDAPAVEVAKQKLIAARHEREVRDLIESISNLTHAHQDHPRARRNAARRRRSRARSRSHRTRDEPAYPRPARGGCDRTSAQILEVIARAFDVLAH